MTALRSGPPTRAEYCAVALAECFRGDGELLANPIGTLPTIGGRLAKATFEPALVMTDGEALLVENILPVGVDFPEKVVAGYNPYRAMFDVVWSGRRHIIMGAVQLDAFGNQNFAFIGPPEKPTAQLLGMRGAPGNTIHNKTSYWIPNHSRRVLVPEVSVVSGVGNDRAASLGKRASTYHHLVRVVTNLCVLDFDTPERRLRLQSLHPGVTVADVVAATGFELAIPSDVPQTRPPVDEELRWIREVIDPLGLGEQEVPNL
ncbi:MAG: CoA-transferase subunit beta [Acidimicrobiia bacterium]